MEALLDWLLGIWDELIPFVVIDPWEEGFRVRLGKHTKVLKPGVHVSLPWIDTVTAIDVKRQAVNLPNQNIWTLDRKAVTISGAVEYAVTDTAKVFLDVQDLDESLIEVTQGLIADYVVSVDEENLHPTTMAEEMLPLLHKEGEEWGVDITRIYISDLVLTLPIRIFS